MKKHNFNAGPCILPEVAVKNTANAVLDLDGIGLSLISISHRSKEFQAIIDETEALWHELLNIPAGYKVLFLGGGASMQFCMVPYNFLNKKAAYVETGVWAKKARAIRSPRMLTTCTLPPTTPSTVQSCAKTSAVPSR